ncbi:CheR family methyltransferase [Beijerinckia indica]|uniref:Chemotaxis protein methyltransferase n=1 Tax=Beijerinckia indica subsp. indica (strain ATCC 9039 / DSM 1715 / NCIMB 8712) TaxID=395963 RepID=B2IGA4_BEII9|nr:protein-glutamate O-methyltransferase [Beijerinckia indica]ACB97178.1 MCP methyltransferase, CheR-type [Beijerinckia indica subsp. indica ATCC 9039]
MTSLAPASGSKTRDAGLVDGEFILTMDDFQRISHILHASTGIYLPDTKATLVYSRLAKRLRALGLTSFRDYCALVSHHDGLDERQHMLAALTTNVTRFFREPHHFDHLRTRVLPRLLENAQHGERVRLWSAACSNGQEPYSIALTILALLPEAPRFDIKILATDIDPTMLAEGRRGLYGEAALASVPKTLRHWFTPIHDEEGKTFAVAESMRALVSFRELNLIGDWPMKGVFQAIFCRNVVIYFEEATQNRIWDRFVPLLEPDGALYIGHSERLAGGAAQAFASDGITTYRRLREAHA